MRRKIEMIPRSDILLCLVGSGDGPLGFQGWLVHATVESPSSSPKVWLALSMTARVYQIIMDSHNLTLKILAWGLEQIFIFCRQRYTMKLILILFKQSCFCHDALCVSLLLTKLASVSMELGINRLNYGFVFEIILTVTNTP